MSPGAASRSSPGRVTGRALRSSPDTVIELAIVGATAGPPAVLGAPVSYGVGGAGVATAVVALLVGAGVRGLAGALCLALTSMVGSGVVPDRTGPAGGVAAARAGLGAAGCGAGVVAAGASPVGAGGGAGGAVCAQALTQNEVTSSDVDPSSRARNDITTPFLGEMKSDNALTRRRFARPDNTRRRSNVLPRPRRRRGQSPLPSSEHDYRWHVEYDEVNKSAYSRSRKIPRCVVRATPRNACLWGVAIRLASAVLVRPSLAGSVHRDIRELCHLRPFLGVVGDEFAEISG